MPSTRLVVPCVCACCLAAAATYAADDLKTLRDLQQEAAKSQVSQTQSGGADSKLKVTVGATSKPANCPAPVALDSLRHEIAYDRTEELDPLRGLSLIHVHVWERGSLTVFYVDEALRTYPANTRLAYFVGAEGAQGYASCPADQDWQKCVGESAGMEGVNNVARTCITAVDLRAIAAWAPSPNDETKRGVAEQLRREIEAEWQGVQEIVIRDFNLKDRQITMYLKLPDGDYYQGCGFHARREPHCEGWHLFGQAPVSSIRKWIFEKPYRLK